MKTKKKKQKKLKRSGAPPGTLEFTGEQRLEQVMVHQIRYNGEEISEVQFDLKSNPGTLPEKVTWYDVRGLHDVALVERFGQHFNIHPLVLEDILHTQQRPKFEEYGDEAFIVINALTYNKAEHELNSEQIALYFGENFLLSFQENADDTFLAVRERLEAARGRIRNRKSDYLAYALVDNVVDNYFQILECFEERMETLEADINTDPSRETKEGIHHLKFQMLALRKSVMPLREAVGKFSRSESKIMDESTGLFVRDLYDHVIRIADLIETYRDMLNGLQELYLSELSIRMNNVIQVLTIITTIFVPLTFLAGIYGMNFDNIPELHFHHGYYYLWGVMGLISIASLVYFKKKKWI
ncbi:MAG: magnesium/cobalt transporter CorA [Saprospiraceae bacterium]